MIRVPMLSCLFLLIACTEAQVVFSGEQSDETSYSSKTQIDRIGRPEMTNFTIQDFDLKIEYNTANSFDLSEEQRERYGSYFDYGIAYWDALDDVSDLQIPSKEHLVLRNWLVDDYLVVDTSKPCQVSTQSYLDIELSLQRGVPHQTCGGRTPDDDFVDRYASLLIGGFAQPLFATDFAVDEMEALPFNDGLDRPNSPASNVWPYLPAPL